MPTSNRKNGITLIALIITIIVMLILVGVTINVALNGGLFDTATDAKVKTQKQMEKEELISTAVGLYNARSSIIDDEDLEREISKLNNDYTNGTVEGTKYIIIGKSGTKWQVDLKTAEVKEYEDEFTIDYDSYYNVTFRDLSKFDWENMIESDKEYIIPFFPEGGTIENQGYSQVFFAYSEVDGFVADYYPSVSIHKHYLYDTTNNIWVQRIDTNPEILQTVTIERVKLFPSDTITSYGYGALTDSQLNEIAILEKVD